MSQMIVVIASSDEYMAVDVKAPSDPTGETAPAVSVVAVGGTHSSYSAGTWDAGGYNTNLKTAIALLPSPLTLGLTAGRYEARIRTHFGAESPIYEDLMLVVKA